MHSCSVGTTFPSVAMAMNVSLLPALSDPNTTLLSSYSFCTDWPARLQNQFRQRPKATSSWPFNSRNLPLRLRELSHGFVHQATDWIRQWIIGHKFAFPPGHVPKRPIVEVRNTTLQAILFNYKLWLRQWEPGKEVECTRAHFPEDVPRLGNGHLFTFAASLVDPTSILGRALSQHLEDTVWLSESAFMFAAEREIQRWQKRWRLPDSLRDEWAVFLAQQWKLHPTVTEIQLRHCGQLRCSTNPWSQHGLTGRASVMWRSGRNVGILVSSVTYPAHAANSFIP